MKKYLDEQLKRLATSTRKHNQNNLKHIRINKRLKRFHSIHNYNHHKSSNKKHNQGSSTVDIAFSPIVIKKNGKDKDTNKANNNSNSGNVADIQVSKHNSNKVITRRKNKKPSKAQIDIERKIHQANANNLFNEINIDIPTNSSNIKTHHNLYTHTKAPVNKHIKGIDRSTGTKLYLKEVWKHDSHNPNNHGPSISA